MLFRSVPELPEVELARRDLYRWTVTGESLSFTTVDAKTVRGKLSTNPKDALIDGVSRLSEDVNGCRAVNVLRAGKRLGWQFDGPVSLLVHLGMSGKWVSRDTSELSHVRVRVQVGTSTLSFIDPRRFGCLVPVPTAALGEWLNRGLGPDALEHPMDGPSLSRACNSGEPSRPCCSTRNASREWATFRLPRPCGVRVCVRAERRVA